MQEESEALRKLLAQEKEKSEKLEKVLTEIKSTARLFLDSPDQAINGVERGFAEVIEFKCFEVLP